MVLITGAARRVGAGIAEHLAAKGADIVIHYNQSAAEAQTLAARLQAQYSVRVRTLQADLRDPQQISALVEASVAEMGRLDVLINNASAFYATPMAQISPAHWDDLLNGNLRAPFFLAQAATPYLRASQGCIVNIADIYAHTPLLNYLPYSVSKAGLVMLTQALAKELGPDIRVNAVAPGVALWADTPQPAEDSRDQVLLKTALKRPGSPLDIAKAVAFLIFDAPYVTGEVLRVDGGRGVY